MVLNHKRNDLFQCREPNKVGYLTPIFTQCPIIIVTILFKGPWNAAVLGPLKKSQRDDYPGRFSTYVLKLLFTPLCLPIQPSCCFWVTYSALITHAQRVFLSNFPPNVLPIFQPSLTHSFSSFLSPLIQCFTGWRNLTTKAFKNSSFDPLSGSAQWTLACRKS